MCFGSAPSIFSVRISSFEMSYQLLRDEISTLLSQNERIQTHTDAYKRIQTHTNAYKRIQTHTNAYRRIQTHTNQSAPISSFRKELILLNQNPGAHPKLLRPLSQSSDGVEHFIRGIAIKKPPYILSGILQLRTPPLIRNRGTLRGGFLNMVYRFSKNLIFERFRENHSKKFSASGQIGE